MSCDRCSRCSRQVDTDFDLDCYIGDECVCEPCRDRADAEEELLKQQAAQAAEDAT